MSGSRVINIIRTRRSNWSTNEIIIIGLLLLSSCSLISRFLGKVPYLFYRSLFKFLFHLKYNCAAVLINFDECGHFLEQSSTNKQIARLRVNASAVVSDGDNVRVFVCKGTIMQLILKSYP